MQVWEWFGEGVSDQIDGVRGPLFRRLFVDCGVPLSQDDKGFPVEVDHVSVVGRTTSSFDKPGVLHTCR